jgi:hypothetical protein
MGAGEFDRDNCYGGSSPSALNDLFEKRSAPRGNIPIMIF